MVKVAFFSENFRKQAKIAIFHKNFFFWQNCAELPRNNESFLLILPLIVIIMIIIIIIVIIIIITIIIISQ